MKHQFSFNGLLIKPSPRLKAKWVRLAKLAHLQPQLIPITIEKRLERPLNAYAADSAPNQYEPNPCLSKAEMKAKSKEIIQLVNKLKGRTSNEIELKDSNALNREIPLQKTVSLSFDFPFYGQPIRTLAVTANGLINMHPQQQTERPWRFIAPLMASCQGFDLKNDEIDSSVRWEDTGKVFKYKPLVVAAT
ncbi:Hypothetical predicted protein [Cloeon dipterum]|uniref:Uncharacterized protein n=1 Tax=Cloeon dipterum TaxID=197152 RepID=A0A8S1E7D2_9INSE|nr:Hypothetical predicted protein [Cloeon dipterum]